jgi:hypothetical protein
MEDVLGLANTSLVTILKEGRTNLQPIRHFLKLAALGKSRPFVDNLN